MRKTSLAENSSRNSRRIFLYIFEQLQFHHSLKKLNAQLRFRESLSRRHFHLIHDGPETVFKFAREKFFSLTELKIPGNSKKIRKTIMRATFWNFCDYRTKFNL